MTITVAEPTVEELVVGWKEKILKQITDHHWHLDAQTWDHLFRKAVTSDFYDLDRYIAEGPTITERLAQQEVDAWLRRGGHHTSVMLVLSLAVVKESRRPR